MAGEANDAASADTQVQMEGRSQIPKTFGGGTRNNLDKASSKSSVVLPNGTRSMTQWLAWKAICTATRWQDYCGNAYWKNVYTQKKENWSNVGNDCIYIEDIKMVGRRECSALMWATLRKKIELAASFDQVQVYLGCGPRGATVAGKRSEQQLKCFAELQRQM